MHDELVRAGSADELRAAGRRVVTVGRTPVLVLWHEGAFHALDNRCPHMGFPLSKGDVKNGVLDCHWHHARFDVTCGATLDPWADDVERYEVVVKDGAVFVDPDRPPRDARAHGLARLARGLDDDLRLVVAKSVIALCDADVPPVEAVALGAEFGSSRHESGWQPGLSILAAMTNVLPKLDAKDRRRALTHALVRVADDCARKPPRRPLPPLVGSRRGADGLRGWFRETVDVRDAQGAERVLATIAVEHGAAAALDAVLAAATDHRYMDVGHSLDYAVKCAEMADHVGDEADAALLFTSLVPQLVQAPRMEETSAWRRPVDVAAIVESASADVPSEPFRAAWTGDAETLPDEDALVDSIVDGEPAETATDLVRRLKDGVSPAALADAVVSAATLRVLRFGTSNETPDWDVVHHTLTYANAVAEAMRRAPSAELFRAVLDGAMSVHLDRFLNVPAAPLPKSSDRAAPDALAAELLRAYDRRGGMDECATLAWRFLENGGAPDRLLATLAHALLREDAGFHAFQEIDIAWRRLMRRGDSRASRLSLVAAARWTASQFPTRRAAEQTFDIASRLARGESPSE
jgi:nitrite reductase/ring-hydroxylating ferredoxin subunit